MSKTRDALKYPIYYPRKWGQGTVGRALPRPWWGLDTERDSKTGEFVCGKIANDTQEAGFQVIGDLPPGCYLVWNLPYDIEGMIRDLGKEEGWAMREDGTSFIINGAKCIYYMGKRFEYQDHNGKRVFLSADTFFNRIGLKEAAKLLCVCTCDGCKRHKKEPKTQQHCGSDELLCPMKDPVDASKMSLKRYNTDKNYRNIVDKYCVKDARIAYRLMVYLDEGFRELGVEIGGTPGATARRFLANIQPFPKVVQTVNRTFLEAYGGGKFDLWKRGVFEKADQYDRISAYPAELATCPMLTDTAYQKYTTALHDDALYGAYEIGFKADEYLGVAPRWKGSTRVYSNKEERTWLCKPELDWLQKRGHNFKIHRGVEVYDPNAHDGWRKLVMPLFNQKEGHTRDCEVNNDKACNCQQVNKGKPISAGAKVGVNSMYGILAQLIQKGGQWVPIEEAKNAVDFAGTLALEMGPRAYDAGQFCAFIYSSTLTSKVRVSILDASIEMGPENVIGSHTDSMHGIVRTMGGRLRTGTNCGDWKLEETGQQLIILKTGQYAIGEKVKGRGFSKRRLNPADESEVPQRQKVDLWAPTHTRTKRIGVKTTGDWSQVSRIVSDDGVANNFAWEIKRKWDRDFSVRMIAQREWIDSEALTNVE